jgi:type I restriction enzyme R subunit
VQGFNSLMATQSITAAKSYYQEFKKAQADLPEAQRLKVATIFSFAANEAESDGMMPEEGFEVAALDVPSRDFLESAISDYNKMFVLARDLTRMAASKTTTKT